MMTRLLPLLFLCGCAFMEEPRWPQVNKTCKSDPHYWVQVREPQVGSVEWVVVPWAELQRICGSKWYTHNACIFVAGHSVVFSWLTKEQASEWVTSNCESLLEHELTHKYGYEHKERS